MSEQMRADLERLARRDGCIAAGWALTEIERLQVENQKLHAELHERNEQHRRVIESPCPDEQHCTCVPILRREIERLKAEKQRLSERPQLRVNVEALVDDVDLLSSELDALRQFVHKHSRASGHKMDGTAQYRLTGAIGRGRSLWDAINRAENKTEMGDE